jgi:hypothetical protein
MPAFAQSARKSGFRDPRNIEVAFENCRGFQSLNPAVLFCPCHYKGPDLNALADDLAGTGIDVRSREWYPG